MDHCHLYILIYFIYRYYSINKGFLQEMGAGCLPPDTVMLSPIPKCKGVQAPSAPGFYGPCASRRTMVSAHRAGWFRGSYICCLRQRPMSESEHNPSTQPAAPAAPLCALWAPPLNLLNPLNPHAEGVSARAARRPQRRSSCTKSKSIFLPKPCVKSGRQ